MYTVYTVYEVRVDKRQQLKHFVNNVDIVADKWQFKIDTLWILVSFMLKMFYHIGDSVMCYV